MSIIALDYGTKRVGVAVSDPMGILASPLPALLAQPEKAFFESLKKIIAERGTQKILVGLPRNMDGSQGESAKNVLQFCKKLETHFPTLTVQTVDERLSTVQASRMLHEAGYDTRQQKTKIDSASAQILLQQFLDSSAPMP